MKKIFLILITTILLGANCENTTQHNLRPKPTPESTNFCKAAEFNLLKVCPIYAQPTKTMIVNGETFKDFCENTQNNGIFIDPECLSKVTSCDQVPICDGSK